MTLTPVKRRKIVVRGGFTWDAKLKSSDAKMCCVLKVTHIQMYCISIFLKASLGVLLSLYAFFTAALQLQSHLSHTVSAPTPQTDSHPPSCPAPSFYWLT